MNDLEDELAMWDIDHNALDHNQYNADYPTFCAGRMHTIAAISTHFGPQD